MSGLFDVNYVGMGAPGYKGNLWRVDKALSGVLFLCLVPLRLSLGQLPVSNFIPAFAPAPPYCSEPVAASVSHPSSLLCLHCLSLWKCPSSMLGVSCEAMCCGTQTLRNVGKQSRHQESGSVDVWMVVVFHGLSVIGVSLSCGLPL